MGLHKCNIVGTGGVVGLVLGGQLKFSGAAAMLAAVLAEPSQHEVVTQVHELRLATGAPLI